MKKIIVSVTNDLITDQRVNKTCTTLAEHNFEVLLIGRKSKNSICSQQQHKTKRIKLMFNKGFLFYAEYNVRLFVFLLFSKKDILLSNDLDTLLPNYLVSKIQSKKLVFDSHELFSEIPELTDRPIIKKTWTYLENLIIPRLKNTITVSDSIAYYYQKKYQSRFTVIRNVPTITTINSSQFPFNTNSKKIILYQGSVNLGRGIELMIDTMKYLDDHLFVIIGTGDIIHQLIRYVSTNKLTDKIIFLGRKTPQELKAFTPLADMGISFEEDMGLNYRYALPNKIFDYIHADIPIIVSDLPEMKKIIEHYKVGEVLKDRNPKNIASQIENILTQDFSKKLSNAKSELNWDLEKAKLLQLFENLQ